MPRAIANIGQGNPATYKLGASEEFAVLAVSCVLEALRHNPPYGYPAFEWRAATGGLIYRQTMNTTLNDSLGIAASAGGEPWYVSNVGQFGFPQTIDQQEIGVLSIRIPILTLTPGCTFNIYVGTSVNTGNEPPDYNPSPDHTVTTIHLWVQDAGGRRVLPDNPPPLLTHEPA